MFVAFSARYWGIVALLFISLLFLLFQGGKFAFMLFSIVAALSLYILLGRWSGVSNVRGVRTLPDTVSGGTIEAGTSVAVHVQVHIPGFWPVPYVTIQEKLTHSGGEEYTIETILIPDWKRRAEVSYVTPPLRRGVYRFEDTDCATEDIFGLFRHQGRLRLPYAFKVFPQRVDIRDWKQLHHMFRGNPHTSARTRFYRETAQVNGIREYINGDRLSRIHWHASAKTGSWKSKEFEREAIPKIVFVLDRNMSGYRNQEQFELAVSVATSLLDYAICRDMAVGLLSAGKETKVLEPERGDSQKNAIMNHFIEVELDGMNPLREVLQERVRTFIPGTLFVVVSPEFGDALAPSLVLLQQRRMMPFHMWIAAEVSLNVHEQWVQYLRAAGLSGCVVTSLDRLPLVVGGNK